MADTRSYIVNRKLGIGCLFYSRFGDQYRVGSSAGFIALVQAVSSELINDDDFFITDSESCMTRIGEGPLVRFSAQDHDRMVMESNAARDTIKTSEVLTHTQEVIQLKNRIAALENKLIGAGLEP